jgi:hypothetical protein
MIEGMSIDKKHNKGALASSLFAISHYRYPVAGNPEWVCFYVENVLMQ